MPYQFDYRRYTNRLNTETGQIEPTETLSPRSDAYANNGFIISFYHMITGKELKFKAFITSFNETYTPDYASEQVFGRADPIHTYRGTTRSIALGFVFPAESISEAYENLAKTQTLAQMQYPAYTDVQNALTIAQAPLVRLKVMNLLRAANKGPDQQLTGGPINLYDSYKSEDNPEFGLLGIIDSLTVDHQLAADIGVLEKDVNTILPKQIDIQVGFKPLHEHTNGWIKNDNDKFDFAEPSFPYGAAEYNNTGVAAVEYSNLSEEPTRAEQESAEAETPFEGADGSGGSSISGTDRLVDGQY